METDAWEVGQVAPGTLTERLVKMFALKALVIVKDQHSHLVYTNILCINQQICENLGSRVIDVARD